MKVVVSKPELATEISKAIFVRFLSKQTSLKNGPTSTVLCHVTQHLDWVAAIRIDDIYAIEKTRRSFFALKKLLSTKVLLLMMASCK